MKPLTITTIILLLLLLSASACSAVKTARIYYIGTIGKAAVQMDLTFTGSKVTGEYWYENSTELYDAQGLMRNTLSLSGILGGKGQITLDETDATEKKTGIFIGTLTVDELHFSGTWRKDRLASSLSFSVKAVVRYATVALDDAKRNIHAIATYPQVLEPGLHAGDFAAYMKATCNAAMNSFQAGCLDGGFYAGAERGCSEEYTVAIAYYGLHFISLLTEDYQDTWGAHPNSDLIAKNVHFASDSFEVMDTDAIFCLGHEHAVTLSHILDHHLKLLKKARNMEDQPSSKDEDTNEDAVDPKFASNVLLFPKGAVFVFPRYAAGSYAEGEYYVTVPFSELTGVLNFANTDLPVYILATKPK